MKLFIIYSPWWGKIKNSFFTIEGHKGRFSSVRCGVINVDNLKPFTSRTKHKINNKNKVADIEVTDFASFVALYQRKFDQSPTYTTTQVISQHPSLVEIEINLPSHRVFRRTGKSKKHAANAFAVEFQF